MRIGKILQSAHGSRPSTTLQKKDGIEWNDQTLALLGKIPDSNIAKQFEIPIAKVRLKRLALGLPPAKRQSHRRIQWTPEMDALLGTDIDLTIARKLRISYATVCIRRKKLGIQSYQDQKQLSK